MLNVPHYERRVSSTWPIVVLVVDDCPVFSNTLARLLRSPQISVVLAHDGDEGITYLRSGNVDIVISDADMPGMDGITFLRIVSELWPHVWRVLCTGYPSSYREMYERYSQSVDRMFAKGQEHEVAAMIRSIAAQRLADGLEYEGAKASKDEPTAA